MYMHVFVQKRENEREQQRERGGENYDHEQEDPRRLSGRHTHFMAGPWQDIDKEKRR